MSQKWIQCWESLPSWGKAGRTAFLRVEQGSGPQERETFFRGPGRDLKCQVGKPGRLPIVGHHCEMSIALEVVKTNFFFFLDQH